MCLESVFRSFLWPSCLGLSHRSCVLFLCFLCLEEEEAERRIASREILGNIRTGGGGRDGELPPEFEVVDLQIVLGQGPWLKRTDTRHCLYHQLLGRQAAKDHALFLSQLNKEVNLQRDSKKRSSSSSSASRAVFAVLSPLSSSKVSKLFFALIVFGPTLRSIIF